MRLSAILHFFAQSDFARSICRFLCCISGFTLPFPALSLPLLLCSAGCEDGIILALRFIFPQWEENSVPGLNDCQN